MKNLVEKIYSKNLRLHNAIHRGERSHKVIDTLVKSGADINNVQFDYTPLNEAIELGHIKTVRFLLKKGADVNKPDRDGFTPLECALTYERFEMVKLLIESGARETSDISVSEN